MKKFRFSLAALLSLRKEQTQKCEFLLAAELGKLMVIKKRIEKTIESEDKALFSSRVNLDGLRMRENLLRRALNERRTLKIQLAEAEKEVEKVRRAYLEARSKSAALEKLRDKRRRYWISAVRQKEIKDLDEVSRGAAPRPNLI